MSKHGTFRWTSFPADIVRGVDPTQLYWPSDEEAEEDSALGFNHDYMDFREMPWDEVQRALDLEATLISRLELSSDPAKEYDAIQDEMRDMYDDVCCLDLGMASAVIALSAAGCIPFTSCNAGAFGGSHRSRFPLVGFYARSESVPLLLKAAEMAEIGLRNADQGSLIAYSNDIRSISRFSEALLSLQQTGCFN